MVWYVELHFDINDIEIDIALYSIWRSKCSPAPEFQSPLHNSNSRLLEAPYRLILRSEINPGLPRQSNHPIAEELEI